MISRIQIWTICIPSTGCCVLDLTSETPVVGLHAVLAEHVLYNDQNHRGMAALYQGPKLGCTRLHHNGPLLQ